MTIENLSAFKAQLIKYYEDGLYEIETNEIIEKARSYLSVRLSKPAISVVCDVDDSAINLYPYWKRQDFAGTELTITNSFFLENEPANKKVLEFYKYCVENKVNFIFLTSRPESLNIHDCNVDIRSKTIRLLNSAGYTNFKDLIMKQQNDERSDLEFKQSAIAELQKTNYIAVNVGDQWSDWQNSAEYQCELINKIYDTRYY